MIEPIQLDVLGQMFFTALLRYLSIPSAVSVEAERRFL